MGPKPSMVSSNEKTSMGSHGSIKKDLPLFRSLLHAALYSTSGVQTIDAENCTSLISKRSVFEKPLLVTSSIQRNAEANTTLPPLAIQDVTKLLENGYTVRSINVGQQEFFNLSLFNWNEVFPQVEGQEADQRPQEIWNAQFRLSDYIQLHSALFKVPDAITSLDWFYQFPFNAAQTCAKQQPIQSPMNKETYGAIFRSGTFQDFTVCCDGKASWYHVTQQELWAFLVPPSEINHKYFTEWRKSIHVRTHFFALWADRCIKVIIRAGDILAIPPGWMTALYAPMQDLHRIDATSHTTFYYGYFHSTYALPGQLRSYKYELTDFPDLQQHNVWQPYYLLSARLWTVLSTYTQRLTIMLSMSDDTRKSVSEVEKVCLKQFVGAVRTNLSWLMECIQNQKPVANTETKEKHYESEVPQTIVEAETILNNLENLLNASNWLESSELEPLPCQVYPQHGNMYINPTAPNQQLANGTWNTVSPWPSPDPENAYPHHPDFTQSLGTLLKTEEMTSDSSTVITCGTVPLSSSSYIQSSPAYSPYLSTFGVKSQGTPILPFSPSQPLSDPCAYYPHSAMQNNLLDLSSVQSCSSQPPSYMSINDTGLHHEIDTTRQLHSASHMVEFFNRHRISCHRCGNLRKKNVRCLKCPHIFCQKYGRKQGGFGLIS
uniref:Uncharacterized protein AlNc14C3G458 n=1 Tax=Albugo laibachii Nc14 TaxID=890382 RepID=F0VZY0_9STRA|nr:conserved hypothetical protein [Albugo laibachii Nc14]|eukprot:CCA14351.1 conserved hypothetical protein [Albugo laibachii Nc14]